MGGGQLEAESAPASPRHRPGDLGLCQDAAQTQMDSTESAQPSVPCGRMGSAQPPPPPPTHSTPPPTPPPPPPLRFASEISAPIRAPTQSARRPTPRAEDVQLLPELLGLRRRVQRRRLQAAQGTGHGDRSIRTREARHAWKAAGC